MYPHDRAGAYLQSPDNYSKEIILFAHHVLFH